LSRGLNYMTDFQIEKMSANLYRQSHTDLQRFARNGECLSHFQSTRPAAWSRSVT
jgi:hypothetical protein